MRQNTYFHTELDLRLQGNGSRSKPDSNKQRFGPQLKSIADLLSFAPDLDKSTQKRYSFRLEFKGNYVLICHEKDPMMVVAGYIVGDYKKPQENSVPITEVESISDDSQKKELEARVKKLFGVDKKIYFW